MKWSIGQLVVSSAEPELGLGTVVAVQNKRIEIGFATETRMYSSQEAPIKRKLFRSGNRVILESGIAVEIAECFATELCSYRTSDGITISEKDIVDQIGGGSPEDILSSHSSSPEEYAIRATALTLRSESESSPVRGFMGGKIDLMPHQFAVASTITRARGRRFFLADEVGLGKTIESALAIHKLLVTGEISRVLIVTPVALMYQWFVELYRKFSLTIRIADSELVESFISFDCTALDAIPLLLVSVDQLADDSVFAKTVAQNQWDVMIVDEAHHLEQSNPAFGRITALAVATPDLLLLSATPDALSPESFFLLLNLLEPEKFRSFETFTEEQTLYKTVSELADSILAGEELNQSQRAFLQVRFPSKPNWTEPSHRTLAERNEIVALLSDICGIGRALFRHSRSVVAPGGDRQVHLVALQSGTDPVGEWLDRFLKEQKENKVVIICSDKAAMEKLNRTLTENSSRRIALFHESMTILQLDRSVAWFADPEGAECLLSTQIGCEGRNFQFAHHLVLIDLPSDPELLEQRIGRVDRIGRTSPVSIVVPFVVGHVQERLARWYHEGMNAFCATVPGGFRASQKFLDRALAANPDSHDWNAVIEETHQFCGELITAVEQGRHRLLELSGDDRGNGEKLISLVNESEESGFDQPIEMILTHFGVEIEELGPELIHLNFENITDHSFPVPLGSEEDGCTATFSREIALAREDALFITPDHPMVVGAIDLLLSSESGKFTAIRLPGQGEEGVLCEQIWTIVPGRSHSVSPEKFLPLSVEKILFDEYGDRVEELFGESLEWGRTLEHGDPEELLDQWHETVSDLITAGETLLEEKRASRIETALGQIEQVYDSEVSRVNLIGGDNANRDRVRLLEEKSALVQAIRESEIHLESLRLVAVEE